MAFSKAFGSATRDLFTLLKKHGQDTTLSTDPVRMTIVSNTVLYPQKLLRVDGKSSHYQKKK